MTDFSFMTSKQKSLRMKYDRKRRMIRLGASGTVCAVCEQPKPEGIALCQDCLAKLDQTDRNILHSGYEGFDEIVSKLRLKIQIDAAGFSLVKPKE